jgi:hypothetical protein
VGDNRDLLQKITLLTEAATKCIGWLVEIIETKLISSGAI